VNAAGNGSARRERPLRGLLIDLVLPTGLYYGLRGAGLDVYLSLIISAAVPAVYVLPRLTFERRVDGLGVYVLLTILLGLGFSLISGSVQFLLAKEGWLTGMSGVFFLLSLRSRKPLAYLFAQPMMEGRLRRLPKVSWELLWAQAPAFRRMWRISTVLWGIGLLVDAVLRVVMAYTLSPDSVPALGSALAIATSLVLIVITNICYVRAGLFDERSALYAPLLARPDGPSTAAPSSAFMPVSGGR
jgi:hypothetical protein